MAVHWGGRGPGHMGRGMGSFNPMSLFTAGEKGGIWLPENSGVSVGTGVATVTDASPNAKNATQGTGASQPILRQNATTGVLYWEFDGTNDSFATATIDMTGTDKVTAFVAVRKLSDAARAMLLEFGNAPGAASFRFETPQAAAANYTFLSGGSTIVSASTNSYAAPNSAVLTGIGNISGDSAILRVNGAQIVSTVTDQGSGNYGNLALYIGRRGGASLPFNGHLYGLIIVGRACTAAEIAATEAFLNRRIGAF